MEKDIYIIKNLVNGKVYIGQSVRAQQRWSAHKSETKLNKPTDTSALHKAMRKYGIENFTMEILERTLDYNAREQFYIKHYNALIPNGYNIALGGDGNLIARNNEEVSQVKRIKEEIKNSSKRLVEIAKDYNISLKRISAINRGLAYPCATENYPLRARDDDTITKAELKNIYNLLINTDLSMREIARQNGCNNSIVRDVNLGKKHHIDDIEYPIRKKEIPDYVEKIIWDIQNTKMSLRAISKKYGLSSAVATNINTGRYYNNPNFSYPLRSGNK